MNNIKAYAVETIDGSTRFFNIDEIEEAQRLFDSRGSSMFALYMHHAQIEPIEALESLQAENKLLKSQLISAKHLLENQRLLIEEYSFNYKHLPSIESEREANQILTNENQNLLEVLEAMISDLVLRAELRGDDCLDISDGILRRAEIAITKAKVK